MKIFMRHYPFGAHVGGARGTIYGLASGAVKPSSVLPRRPTSFSVAFAAVTGIGLRAPAICF
jgi:hypothetical protein